MSELLQKVRDALSNFWDERALPGGFDGATTVEQLISPVESMTAVEVLAELDGVVDAKLPSRVIQAGGYSTKEEFVDKLSAAVFEFLAESK